MEFHRLDDGAREARGLGLGLSIVERIARVLNHPVELVSRAGKGSRFSVELPLAAPVPVAVEAPAPQPNAAALRDLHVMVIDNEPPILDGMRVLLSGWGCRVTTALDAREAARKAGESGERPDALVVDYHLDEGTGIDAVVQLRWRFGVEIPAILVTADRSQPVREEAASKGMTMLNKPLKPAALRAFLSRLRSTATAAE
jgi:CheY-like chemotaxis protein